MMPENHIVIKNGGDDCLTSQKIDNLLGLAMDSSAREREKSLDLNVGYDSKSSLWEVIVKYTGDISKIENDAVTAVPLLNGYAVVTLPESGIRQLANMAEVEYIEKPKRLFFAARQGKEASCIFQVQIYWWELWIPVWTIGIRISAMRMGAAEF